MIVRREVRRERKREMSLNVMLQNAVTEQALVDEGTLASAHSHAASHIHTLTHVRRKKERGGSNEWHLKSAIWCTDVRFHLQTCSQGLVSQQHFNERLAPNNMRHL